MKKLVYVLVVFVVICATISCSNKPETMNPPTSVRMVKPAEVLGRDGQERNGTGKEIIITSPFNHQVFTNGQSITIKTHAHCKGIKKVLFFAGKSLLGEVKTPPYKFVWGKNDARVGEYVLTAKVITENGEFTSDPITVPVVPPGSIPPTITVTSPSPEDSFTEGDVITVKAKVVSTDSTINGVDFYDGTNFIGTVFAAPYTFSTISITPGKHLLMTRAFLASGASSYSTPVVITVDPVKKPSIRVKFTFDSANMREWTTYGTGFQEPRAPFFSFPEMGHGTASTADLRAPVNTEALKRGHFLVAINFVPGISPRMYPAATINWLPFGISVTCSNDTCSGEKYFSGLPLKSGQRGFIRDIHFSYNRRGDNPAYDKELKWKLLPNSQGGANYVIAFPGRKLPPGSR